MWYSINAPSPSKSSILASLPWPACTATNTQQLPHLMSADAGRVCQPVSCSSASLTVTHLHNVAEQTTSRGVPAIPSMGFFSSTVGLPPLCWRRPTHSGCLLLSAFHFSALPDFSGLNASLSSEPGLNLPSAQVSWPVL